jgi:glyoxylase-like metal-dependent hydrolase (beta-lactamase superfamily II)
MCSLNLCKAMNPSAPSIEAFFHDDTETVSYLVACPVTGEAAIIDPVLDFDAASARTSTRSAQRIADAAKARGLKVQWILETHVHADHLSAGDWLRQQLGGRLAIGARIREVQARFKTFFHLGEDFHADGRDFDHLFEDGEAFRIGQLQAQALWVPGHTPADMAYLIGGALFVGDTLFMPDVGTARADFPGGDAATLYRSIHKLLALPSQTPMYLCHDYPPAGAREHRWQTTVGEQRAANIHVHEGIDEASFVARRQARDATLATPRLFMPSLQVNVRGGALPPPADNGLRYLSVPLNALGA